MYTLQLRLYRSVHVKMHYSFDDGLGYKGFYVEASNMFGQRAWKTVGRHTNRNLETTLLKSCPNARAMSQRVVNHVNSGINGQVS